LRSIVKIRIIYFEIQAGREIDFQAKLNLISINEPLKGVGLLASYFSAGREFKSVFSQSDIIGI
jgi:hypothetical protein